jgi:hypothetical protein
MNMEEVHLTPAQIIDVARGLPTGVQPVAHLAVCDRCRQAVDRFRQVVAAVRAAGVPESALREAKALAADWPEPALPLITGRLVFDNALEPATPGVRGTTHDRHLLVEADPWAVDLRLVRRERTVSITGQLANAQTPTQGCVGVPVLARSADGVVGRDRTGTFGEFTITCADAAQLKLEIRVSSATIAIAIPPARS